MQPANRDRPDHRGTPLRAVIAAVLLLGILLAVPASANTASYYISENGTAFSAEVTLVNQSGYLLISPGFIGEGAELQVSNLTLTAENGTIVNATKASSTEITFPEGNYTLVYDALLDGRLMYAQYLSPFNTTVFLPAGFQISCMRWELLLMQPSMRRLLSGQISVRFRCGFIPQVMSSTSSSAWVCGSSFSAQ